jgi:cytidine deaminase
LPNLSDAQYRELLQKAREVQSLAYAPYSNYQVGAAILCASGKTYPGVNIENESYGGTICAERTAIGQMVMSGERLIRTIAVVTPDGGWPCGICLQSLQEFAEDPDQCEIVVPLENSFVVRTLRELAPYLWSSSLVKK